MYERRRQALLVDLFLTGTNAVTEDGVLVNLDMSQGATEQAASVEEISSSMSLISGE